MSDTIITVKHDLVTVLYLNRPQTLNCFNNELLETLALTVSAGGLKSAVKRVREHPLIRLPNGTYYIFEAGNYSDGLQITFS